MAFPVGWGYYKTHTINGSSGGLQTNYVIPIVVHKGSGSDSGADVYLGSNVRDDFGDVRFTNADGSSELNYYLVQYISGDKALFMVEVPSIPASPSTVDIRVYYSASGETTTSSGADTFVEFEGWEGTSSIDTDGASGITLADETTTVKEGSKAKKNTTDAQAHKTKMQNDNSYDPSNYRIEGWGRLVSGGGTNENLGSGLHVCGSAASNNGYQVIIDQRSSVSPQIRENTDYAGRTDGAMATSLDTWYFLSIYRDSSNNLKAEIYTETALYNQSPSSTTTRTSETTHTGGYHGIYTYNTNHSIWDAIWVRKYVDPEPSHESWGSETTTGTAVADYRDGRITGTLDDNDDRSGRITGAEKLSADYFSVAFTSSVDTSSDRNVKITGQNFTNDEKSSRVSGKDIGTDDRDSKVIGQNSATSDRSGKTTGQDTEADERPANITGQDTAISESLAKTFGQDADADDRQVKVIGKDVSSSEINAKVSGKTTAESDKAVKIAGKSADSNERQVILTGEDTSNASRPAKISGQDSTSNERNIKVVGQTATLEQRLSKTTGKDTSVSTVSSKVVGQDSNQDDRDVKIVGKESANSSRQSKTHGKDVDTSIRASKIIGKNSSISETVARIVGRIDTSSDRQMAVKGQSTASGDIGVKIVGQDSSFSAKLATTYGKDTTNSQRSAKLVGVIGSGLSQRSAKIKGSSKWYKSDPKTMSSDSPTTFQTSNPADWYEPDPKTPMTQNDSDFSESY